MDTAQDSKLDRATERREDLPYLEAQLGNPQTLLVPIWRSQPFARRGADGTDTLTLLRLEQAPELLEKAREVVWLGLFDGVACFALDISPIEAPTSHAALSGSEPTELRGLMWRIPKAEAELALYARALLFWHERHGFCPMCGHETRPRQGGHTRVCSNTHCGTQHFPRTDPCVLVLICDGDRCLLGRSKGWPAGMYSALAGFVEPGESLEQATAREVMEEVGVEIGAMRYFDSQSWPFPASLMMGFVAQARTYTIVVDDHELEAARWVTREELQKKEGFFVPPTGALAGLMIDAFARGELHAPGTQD